jgi:cobalt-zinc-cadmium efflux system outer membrane protein
MSSEYRVVGSENRVVSIETGESSEKNSPLSRGDKGGGTTPLLLPLFILIVTLFSITNTLQAQTPQTIDRPGELQILYTYYQIALEKNPELKSLQQVANAQAERAPQAGSLADPQFRTGFFLNPVNDADFLSRFSAGVSQAFPWFGTLDKRAEIERNISEAMNHVVSARQLEIFNEIQELWFQYFTVLHHAHITAEILELVRDLEAIVESRYETGRSAQLDLLRIEMEEQRLLELLEGFEEDMKPIRTRFNALLNRDPDEQIVVPGNLPQRNLVYTRDELLQIALRNHPGFDRLNAHKKEFQNRMELATLEGRPSFILGLEYQGRNFNMLNLMPDGTELFTGVATVRIPIFRSQYRAQKQEARHQLQSTDFLVIELANRVRTDIEDAINKLRDGQRKHRLITKELVPRTRTAIDLISEEYVNGRAGFDELLQIARELLMLEMERVEKLTIQNSAMSTLEQLTAIDVNLNQF